MSKNTSGAWENLRNLLRELPRRQRRTPRAIANVAPFNLRAEVIQGALDFLDTKTAGTPLNLIEIGCMYQESEGLSTLHTARRLATHLGGGRFCSIEFDEDHIRKAERIIEREKPGLRPHVDFRQGHSLSRLPEVLSEMNVIHLALIDGGAHPEVCLQEFELLASALGPQGMILVDDSQSIAFSTAYPAPRPFGKATLILPLLAIAQYLQTRTELIGANGGVEPNARSLSGLLTLGSLESFAHLSYAEFAHGAHRIIAVARPAPLRGLLDTLTKRVKTKPALIGILGPPSATGRE